MAIAYDFDGTLAPGNMQEHSFIPKLGIDSRAFWQEADCLARTHDADQILTYMQLMLLKAKEKKLPISRQAFREHGAEISFFPGVTGFFDRINSYARQQGVNLEHHIISSGVRDIILGSPIAHHFTNIFASGFIFDEQDVAIWPALAINYTTKTQYLFRINKGIGNSYDNSLINKFIPYEQRPVRFENMIYIGDGETDVPAMKMIKYQGGTAIAVYDPEGENYEKSLATCRQLLADERTDFIAPADYTEGSKLDRLIHRLIDFAVSRERLDPFRSH